MVRVLQIIDNMDIGGMETMLMNYYRNMDRKKVQFDFLIFNVDKCFYEDEIRMLGGRVYKIASRRKNLVKNRMELEIFFKKNKYDIVEIHQGVTYLLPLKLAAKYNIRNIIVHNHGVDEKYKKGLYNIFRKKIVVPYIARTATEFFACSKLVLSDLFDGDIIKGKKYVVVNNAIDVEKYMYDARTRIKMRRQLGLGDEKNIVGHVGRFHYQKNHRFIMALAAKMPEYMFVLVGDGELLEKYKMEKSENVIFLGQRSDINEIMQVFDVFILPSHWEGLPLVAVEAQAAGLPVLLSQNVSREAKITNDVVFLPFNFSKWKNTIMKYSRYARKNNCEVVKDAGYDCAFEAKNLEKRYLEMANEK